MCQLPALKSELTGYIWSAPGYVKLLPESVLVKSPKLMPVTGMAGGAAPASPASAPASATTTTGGEKSVINACAGVGHFAPVPKLGSDMKPPPPMPPVLLPPVVAPAPADPVLLPPPPLPAPLTSVGTAAGSTSDTQACSVSPRTTEP